MTWGTQNDTGNVILSKAPAESKDLLCQRKRFFANAQNDIITSTNQKISLSINNSTGQWSEPITSECIMASCNLPSNDLDTQK